MSEPTCSDSDQEESADGTVPSATVPHAQVQPHGGQPDPSHEDQEAYVDGNLDSRGEVRSRGSHAADDQATDQADG